MHMCRRYRQIRSRLLIIFIFVFVLCYCYNFFVSQQNFYVAKNYPRHEGKYSKFIRSSENVGGELKDTYNELSDHSRVNTFLSDNLRHEERVQNYSMSQVDTSIELAEFQTNKYSIKNDSIALPATNALKSSDAEGPALFAEQSTETLCRFPVLNPFDKSLQNFLKEEPRPTNCSGKHPEIYTQRLDNKLIRTLDDRKYENCSYRVISRRNSLNAENIDSSFVLSHESFPIQSEDAEVPPEHEFIAIYCHNGSLSHGTGNATATPRIALVDTVAFAPLKSKVEMKIAKDLNSLGEKINLVVLGIDGVSHLNFLRVMPKLHKYLMQNLSAIEMNGFVRVGDNTYPNVLATLTSLTKKEARTFCRTGDKFFDGCPFLWQNFSATGYRTSYGEDTPWMSAFNFVDKGFKAPPVDYYLRPFAMFTEEYLGHDDRVNTKLCYGPRMAIETILNYMQKLAKTMGKDKRYFQFIWSNSLTHDFLNQGALGEEVLLKTVQWFHSEGHLNNTIFVLMSDHGMRYGEIRRLKQGRYEENLPLLYFVMPPWFKKKYSLAVTTLMDNRNRLTTPFDLHQTFLDFMVLNKVENEKIEKRSEELKFLENYPRGISMLLPIPQERTCEMAEIPDHFCVCHELGSKPVDIPVNSATATNAVDHAVDALNSMMSKYPECSLLSRGSIHSAEVTELLVPLEALRSTIPRKTALVKVIFSTLPGKADFDATLELNVSTKQWKVMKDISRINLYGNQSHCVQNHEIKKYCFCNDVVLV